MRYYGYYSYPDNVPSKYSCLVGLFGGAVDDIKRTFLEFHGNTLDALLRRYSALYGDQAGKYARKTFPMWQCSEQLPAYLTSEQVQILAAKAAEENVRLEGKARELDLEYRAGVRAIESHIETGNALPRGDLRHSVHSDVKTGAGQMTIRSGCFVATVAYGDRNHPGVVLLRKFRDEVLTRSAAGRNFIDWYWRTGPYLARGISHSPHLRSGSRWLISCLVSLIRRHF